MKDSPSKWELGRDPIDPKATVGQVELVEGAVKMDGSNSFSLPQTVLGDQADYTIEFEVKRLETEQEDTDFLRFVSTIDGETGLAFGIAFYPPHWRSSSLMINGHPTLSQKAFQPGTAYKVTLVAENRQVMLFIDGLLLGMTDAVKPSPRPLTFGELSDKPIIPYELRNIRIYDQAIVPSGYDPSIEMMRTYSGPGYSMQRVDIKDPSLPRILVIGDSISMGYRRYITEHFQGKAYVDYWVSPLMFRLQPEDVKPVNNAWDGVLANGPYEVVSWNHATLHMWDPDKPERCSPETYPACMNKVVAHIKATAPRTHFLWVRCTPIATEQKLDSPKNSLLVMFNRLTDAVMADNQIPEIDLYSICEQNLDKVASDGVHWNQDAYKLMATAICDAIELQLRKTSTP